MAIFDGVGPSPILPVGNNVNANGFGVQNATVVPQITTVPPISTVPFVPPQYDVSPAPSSIGSTPVPGVINEPPKPPMPPVPSMSTPSVSLEFKKGPFDEKPQLSAESLMDIRTSSNSNLFNQADTKGASEAIEKASEKLVKGISELSATIKEQSFQLGEVARFLGGIYAKMDKVEVPKREEVKKDEEKKDDPTEVKTDDNGIKPVASAANDSDPLSGYKIGSPVSTVLGK